MVLMGATFESVLVPVGWVGCGRYHVWVPLGHGDPLAFEIFVLAFSLDKMVLTGASFESARWGGSGVAVIMYEFPLGLVTN